MGFAEEMGNLGEGFITSFDNRVKDIGRAFNDTHKLQRDAHQMMRRFHNENQERAREQRRNLKEYSKHLHDQGNKDHRERRKFHQGIQNFYHDLADETQGNMKALRKEFNQGHRNFQRALSEIQRHRKGASFPEMSMRGFSEPAERRMTRAKPKPQKKRGQKKSRRKR